MHVLAVNTIKLYIMNTETITTTGAVGIGLIANTIDIIKQYEEMELDLEILFVSGDPFGGKKQGDNKDIIDTDDIPDFAG